MAPDESAALCQQLLGELTQLTSAEQAAGWAQRTLPTKNRLTQADAQRLELGFALALSRFDDTTLRCASPTLRPAAGTRFKGQ